MSSVFLFLGYESEQPFPFDILFALGGNSAGKSAFLRGQKEAVHSFIDSFRFPVENKFVRIGLLLYDGEVKIVKNLNQNFVLPYLRRYLDKMNIGQTFRTVSERTILNTAAETVFPYTRDGDQKFLVLFADQTTKESPAMIRQVKEKLGNVEIIFVGAGDGVKMVHAASIASSGKNILTGLTPATYGTAYTFIVDAIFRSMCQFSSKVFYRY